MAGWFMGERRGPQWKHGWKGEALSSLSLPPPQLLAVMAIVFLFLSLSRYNNYKAQVERTEIGFRFISFLLPALLILAARYTFADGRFNLQLPRPQQESIHRAGSSPWGVAALVVLLLVLVSYQSSFHSQWFRPLLRRID